MRPHRWQATRLPRPWDPPGKNTGVGCHFLLQCMKVKSESEIAKSCPTLRDPMDCSPPGFSVHGISQARVLEWVAISFSTSLVSSFYIILFIYVLIYFWLCWVFVAALAFSSLIPGFSCCGAQALACVGFSSCGCRALEHRLSGWGTGALVPVWDLPGSGIEPIFPALAGGFFTTEPSGKPRYNLFNKQTSLSSYQFLGTRVCVCVCVCV